MKNVFDKRRGRPPQVKDKPRAAKSREAFNSGNERNERDKNASIAAVVKHGVTVNRRAFERVRGGHLWIYKSDVLTVEGIGDAPIVSVYDERGRFIAQALYSNQSEITLRVLTETEEPIDRLWWQQRLRAAKRRRDGIEQAADAYRVVFSEGDLLPSLIVDKYGDVLVMQTLSRGTEKLKGMFVELLVEEYSPRLIIERNDVRVRELEGLPLVASVLYGEREAAGEEFEITQHGVRFRVSPLGGQKTGAFLDQRENHRRARDFAHGRALDCFTFNGGFALSIAASCCDVLGLDVSSEAVAQSERNAEINSITNVSFREANVFDALREFELAGERFDTIILDPPAFAKNRASVEAATRGYKEINLRALKLLNTASETQTGDAGGILVTCTCSYHVSESMLHEIIHEAARDARRRVQIIERRAQAVDHPILLGMPETFYLKCVIARVLS